MRLEPNDEGGGESRGPEVVVAFVAVVAVLYIVLTINPFTTYTSLLIFAPLGALIGVFLVAAAWIARARQPTASEGD